MRGCEIVVDRQGLVQMSFNGTSPSSLLFTSEMHSTLSKTTSCSGSGDHAYIKYRYENMSAVEALALAVGI